VVTDTARRRIVSLGSSTENGTTTVYEWDGFGWEAIAAPGPATLIHAALAYDPIAGVTMLFGGQCWSPAWDCYDEYPHDETWLWDGETWTLAADGGPAGRFGGALASLPTVGQVVLFGGGDYYDLPPPPPDDDTTWVWDGQTWTAHIGPGPSARYFPAMAYDPASDRVILFGGYDGVEHLGDTWAWDGAGWERLDVQGPSARVTLAFTTDPAGGRAVLHGGGSVSLFNPYSQAEPLDDTWEWAGSSWRQFSERWPVGGLITYDPTQRATILYETGLGDDYSMESWTLTGQEWALDEAALIPSNRATNMVVYRSARDEILMHGGSGDGFFDPWVPETWSYRHGQWSLLGSDGPDLRYGRLVYDAAHDRVFCIDGYRGTFWEWMEDQWVRLGWLLFGEEVLPVYDEARDEILCLGHSSTQWVWDGVEWTEGQGETPSLGDSASLVYDPRRERVVLVSADWNDPVKLWEWDGVSWEQFDASALGTRGHPSVCYDAELGRVLVFGGGTSQRTYTDTWTWDGVQWELLDDGSAPLYLSHSTLFDASVSGTRRFGRFTLGAPVVSHWVLHKPIAPVIAAQPDDASPTETGYTALTVLADGHSTLTYAWRKDGTPLADDGRVVGSHRRTLSIEPVRPEDAGSYDVVISNSCGTILSEPATLSVTPLCPADFDGDGDADPDDVDRFLTAWSARDPGADLNADGLIDTRDAIAFLIVWAVGCE
jgi:hypothetical protein